MPAAGGLAGQGLDYLLEPSEGAWPCQPRDSDVQNHESKERMRINHSKTD